MAEPTQQDVLDFRKARQQLAAVANQKAQLQAQEASMDAALTELKDTKQKEVYKAVGNILIKKDAAAVKKETQDSKKNIETRISALGKQEESLVNTLNRLKAKLEGKTEKKEAKGKK